MNALKDQYADFRRILMHRRSELLNQSDKERAAIGDQLPDSPGDAADSSVLDSTVDYHLQLADNDRRELLEIRDAFERMKKGEYGICLSCDGNINPERLRHLPQAPLCIDCQSFTEAKFRAAHPHATPKL